MVAVDGWLAGDRVNPWDAECHPDTRRARGIQAGGTSGAADRDPAHADIAALDQYLTGKAEILFDSHYASMKKSRLAYRGTAPDPRVKVHQVFSATSVFLERCLPESATDPVRRVHGVERQTCPNRSPRNPPPPYLLILPMVKVGDLWKLSDVLPNTSKTSPADRPTQLARIAARRVVGPLYVVLATSAHADGGSGGCNVLKDPTCMVGTGGGGGGGNSQDPCAAYPLAAC